MAELLDTVIVGDKTLDYEQLITLLGENHSLEVVDTYGSSKKLVEVLNKNESRLILLDSKMLKRILQEELNRLFVKLEQKENRDYINRLMVKSSGRYYFLKTEWVDWIESSGNYVCIHSADKEYLIRDTMKNMERKLNPDLFYRIHRTAIVNINSIKSIEKWFSGDYKVRMNTDDELMMSRNYTDLVDQF